MSRLFKTTFITFNLCFCITQAHAQYYKTNTLLKDSVILAHGISELLTTETAIYKKRVNTYLTIYQFNRAAQPTFEARFLDTLKLSRVKRVNTNTYIEKNSSAAYYRWNDYSQLKVVTYNHQQQVEHLTYFDDKGKNSGSYHYTYQDSLCMRLDNYSKKHRLSTYYQYTYSNNKKIKSSALYSKKGKLIRFWDYACDDEGKLSQSKSDTFKICTEKSYLADGSIVSTTNSFDYMGNPIKYVEYRNNQNQLTQYLIYRGKNDLLTYCVKNTFIGAKLSSQYIWNADKKGKAMSAFRYSYNVQGSLLSQSDSFFNGQKTEINTYQFTYNSLGLLSSKKAYNTKGKLFNTVNYRYKFLAKKED